MSELLIGRLDIMVNRVYFSGKASLPSTFLRGNLVTRSESIRIGQLRINYLIDGSVRGGMGAFELTVPPRSNTPPPHSHSQNDEFVYVLAGTMRYSVDDVVRDLRAGEWMLSPRGSVHHFSNPGGDETRALFIVTPDIGAQFFRDVAAAINVGGAPDEARLASIMSRYGLTPGAPRTSGTP